MESAQKLFAKMYEQAQASQGAQAGLVRTQVPVLREEMKHTVMMWLTETTEKYKIALSVNDLDAWGVYSTPCLTVCLERDKTNGR